MLEEIKETQANAYKIISNAVKNSKISHAYLIDANNYKYKKEFVFEFAKTLLCPTHEFCKTCECNICKKIDKNIYSEFKLIEQDGMWIKKEQLLELKKQFMYKSVESSRKVYIIMNAEKMNASSSNTLLKFLEEPEENIVAILVTDNIHQLLDTIVSRCQIISLVNNSTETRKIQNYLSREVDGLDEMIVDTIDLIYLIEQRKLNSIVYTKDFINKYGESSKFEIILEIMILFYKDVLNYKVSKCELFDENDLSKIADLNSIEQINDKIVKLLESKNDIKVNANVNLLLDKFIIDIGCDIDGQSSWCNI